MEWVLERSKDNWPQIISCLLTLGQATVFGLVLLRKPSCLDLKSFSRTLIIDTQLAINTITLVLFERLEQYFGKVLIEVDICAAASVLG